MMKKTIWRKFRLYFLITWSRFFHNTFSIPPFCYEWGVVVAFRRPIQGPPPKAALKGRINEIKEAVSIKKIIELTSNLERAQLKIVQQETWDSSVRSCLRGLMNLSAPKDRSMEPILVGTVIFFSVGVVLEARWQTIPRATWVWYSHLKRDILQYLNSQFNESLKGFQHF